MNKSKNEAGFGLIEALIIIIVIVLVAAGGWYALAHHKKKDTTTTTNSTATTSKAEGTSSASKTGKYLDITQWGIKFSLSTHIADAYYDTKTSSSLDSMSLRSHALDSEPICTNDPQSVATIYRVPKDAQDTSIGKKYSDTQGGRTIGNYFYYIQTAQTDCASNEEKSILLQGILNGFRIAGPSIQKM